jgi:hypothetical protein
VYKLKKISINSITETLPKKQGGLIACPLPPASRAWQGDFNIFFPCHVRKVRQGKKKEAQMFIGSVRLAFQLYKLYSLETKKKQLRTSAPQMQKYVSYEKQDDSPSEGSHYYSDGWGYNNTPARWGKKR